VLRRATLSCAALLACAGEAPVEIVSCQAIGPARPVCGFQNPEDLAPLPGRRSLLVSEFGGMEGTRAGALSRYDLHDDERTVLFRGGDADGVAARWGDPSCPGPPTPAFSPHGIDLSRRQDGTLQLLVVNHGGRESVEFFEVEKRRAGYELDWRGCAVAPEGSWLNDVVTLPDGGFLVSHMMPRRGGPGQFLEFAKAMLLRMETGHVLEWQPERGFSRVPGTEVPFANGLEISADGATLYLNSSAAGQVRRIARDTGEPRGHAMVQSPDNSTWAEDGRLWVASLKASFSDFTHCTELERGACPAAFEIVALHPETLETEVVYQGGGAPMGGGTVGLQVGGELFVGSFAGDRILRVALER
jgi:hypothetical protein